ncbi:MAG TPA: hypothetical protein VH500_12170 [Nitrososphaeraceae archaeon]|jgi:hypothetical protein
MAFTYDKDIKKRIEFNKRKNEKQIKAIFSWSNSNLYEVYGQYINASRQIILHTAAKLDGKIPPDNFYCVMNINLVRLVDSHFIYECFDQYRKEKERIYIATTKHEEWPV